MKALILALAVMVTMGIAAAALAHAGGTDQYGCHHDHKNGGYHCHEKRFGPS